jgi:hypothetical protein
MLNEFGEDYESRMKDEVKIWWGDMWDNMWDRITGEW